MREEKQTEQESHPINLHNCQEEKWRRETALPLESGAEKAGKCNNDYGRQLHGTGQGSTLTLWPVSI